MSTPSPGTPISPLGSLREQFHLPPTGAYLCGNSLGATPKSVHPAVASVISDEWQQHLVGGWNRAQWMQRPMHVGDAIAELIGAQPGQTMAIDTTTINLIKVMRAALSVTPPGRSVVLTERENFPADVYAMQSVAADHHLTVVYADRPDDLADLIQQHRDQLALVLLTQVNYRTGRLLDMAGLTERAHEAGALALWDLCHSAGAVDVDLIGSNADFAVGCGYKFLNGGPGAPGFVWVHPRHHDRAQQPLWGWLGHASPFDFSSKYVPAPGMNQFVTSSPSILALTALACGVDTVRAAQPWGGMAALRQHSLALTDAFIKGIDDQCSQFGVSVVTPRDHSERGSQVSLTLAPPLYEHSYAVMRALLHRGIVGDFRAADPIHPVSRTDLLRFGFAPAYTSFDDVRTAIAGLAEVLSSQEWQRPEFAQKAAVT